MPLTVLIQMVLQKAVIIRLKLLKEMVTAFAILRILEIEYFYQWLNYTNKTDAHAPVF